MMVPQQNSEALSVAVPPPPNPCTPSDIVLAGIDVAGIEGQINCSLVNKVRKLVDDHPDRALEVVRGWMAEDYVRH